MTATRRRRWNRYLFLALFGFIALVIHNIITFEVAGSEDDSTHNDLSSNVIQYPLTALNFSSAERFYQRGFWQRMKPVPLDQWQFIRESTRTCTKDLSSQDRVPYVAMIGTQKGGTTALAYFMYNHPQIQYLPTKELHYFDEDIDQFPRNITLNSGTTLPSMSARQIHQDYQRVIQQNMPNAKRPPTKFVLDATPNYMFASDRVPQRLFCGCGDWIKLLVLLRNPIDRAFSQYNMQFHHDLKAPKSQRRGPGISFEEYIELDFMVLRETGVIPRDENQTAHGVSVSPEQEMEAWSTYTKLGLNSPIGRGLYSIQLRHWFAAMKEYKVAAEDSLLVLQSEQMKQNSNATFQKVIHFLNLSEHALPNYGTVHKTQYRSTTMNPQTRAKLQSFFRPYNQQLQAILGNSWKGIWE